MQSHHFRYVSLIAILSIVFLLAAYRLFQLTIIQHDFLVDQTLARSKRTHVVTVPRGDILDRQGRPLAMSLYKQSAWIQPDQIHWDDDARQRIASILSLTPKVVADKQLAKGHFVYLKRHLTPEEFQDLKQLNDSGIQFAREYSRYYPAGESASQLVGRVNIDGEGQEGIELAFNEALKGHSGKEMFSVDRKGHIISERSTVVKAKPGEQVALTIDRNIQFMTYQALKSTVAEFDAQSAEALVVEIPSGAILAVANYPSYNPNEPLKSLQYIRNKVITDINEPGSIIKPISMVALLQYGFDEQTQVDTQPGYLKLNGHEIHDEFTARTLSLSDIIRKSSNIGMSKLMLQVPQNIAAKVYQDMGLNSTVALGFPGERSGHSDLSRKMTSFDRAAISFGYGIETSLVQMAKAIAIIANHGQSVPIHLFKQPETESKQVISREIADQVTHMMTLVTQKGGTGYRASIDGISVAGKTGTTRIFEQGQYLDKQYRASFVGFAPSDDPKYLIIIQVDKPKGSIYGGRVAAPAFKTIFSQIWAQHKGKAI